MKAVIKMTDKNENQTETLNKHVVLNRNEEEKMTEENRNPPQDHTNSDALLSPNAGTATSSPKKIG